MTTEKRPWRRPELTVLVRSRPEESVLAGCKGGGSIGPGDPGRACRMKDFKTVPCNLTAKS